MTDAVRQDAREMRLLYRLIDAGDSHVSGSALAEEFGLSRVSVRNLMEKLRHEGFSFAAVRNKGYRLIQTPGQPHPSLIAALLAFGGEAIPLFCHASLDSTHSEAERLLAAGEKTPFAVIAAAQTRGRGRHGRVWHSPDAGNLYLTFVFRPDLPPARMQRFTLWMGLRVCELLNRIYKVPLALKWPNDLVADGRKVSGMLSEARIDADHMRDLLFGIGLNVNADTSGWPAAVAGRAASLKELAGRTFDLNRLAASLVSTIVGAYQGFVRESYADRFEELWLRHDAMGFRPVRLTTRQGEIRGVPVGLAEDGGLRLQLDDGRIQTFHSGDVSIGTGVAAGS